MVIAPFFSKTALEMMSRKEDKCRCLENLALASDLQLAQSPRFRQVRGGCLLQDNYTKILDLRRSDVVKIGEATYQQEMDMILGWAIGSTSNGNTITLVRDGMLIGNGVAQQDRVGACKLAIMRAQDSGHDTEGAVAYSDSFFPFPDGPEVLYEAGIKAIFTSSGSANDKEVFAACKEWGIIVYSLPDKDIRGFFGH
jgi:phosphoribosylaminoimidazolecarboxamide formyltransferase/IMP cyclohydrolase